MPSVVKHFVDHRDPARARHSALSIDERRPPPNSVRPAAHDLAGRFSGDGFDFRRPANYFTLASSPPRSPQEDRDHRSSNMEVVDLTEDNHVNHGQTEADDGDDAYARHAQSSHVPPSWNSLFTSPSEDNNVMESWTQSNGRRTRAERSSRTRRSRRAPLIDLASSPEYQGRNTSAERPTREAEPVELDGDGEDDIQIVSWETRNMNHEPPDTATSSTWQGTFDAVRRAIGIPPSGTEHHPHESRPRRPPRPSIPMRAHAHIHNPSERPQPPPHRQNLLSRPASSFPSHHSLPVLPPMRPLNLNYAMPAFQFRDEDDDHLGLVLEDSPFEEPDSRPGWPKHDLLPLKPTRPGFTRDPREGDECVCPNCEGELTNVQLPPALQPTLSQEEATRLERKGKEVWVNRNCGHVYCGLCCSEENRTGRAKGKAKEGHAGEEMGAWGRKKLRICVVEGCGEKMSTKGSCFQIYL